MGVCPSLTQIQISCSAIYLIKMAPACFLKGSRRSNLVLTKTS
jgi:hypothetical protein